MNRAKAKLLDAKRLNKSHFLTWFTNGVPSLFLKYFASDMPSKKLIAINKKLS